jgi:hypothetical protein
MTNEFLTCAFTAWPRERARKNIKPFFHITHNTTCRNKGYGYLYDFDECRFFGY